MRRYCTRGILIIAALSTSGCATTPAPPDLQSEEQAIRAKITAWQAAAAAKDADRFATFYAPDASFLMANEPIIRGSSNIRNSVKGMFEAPNMTFTFGPTSIEVARAGDMAYELGTFRFGMDGPTGRVDDRGKYLVAWKKINGEWKAVADAGNSDLPIAEPPMVVMDVEPSGLPFTTNPAASMGWADFAPAGFPAGAKIAMLHGDPAKKGDYTYRLKFPAGYTVPPHFHPESEHITVLSGSFHFGMSERPDGSALASFGPGDFIYVPAKVPHMAMARTETVLQLHGMGPTSRTMVTNR